MVAEDAVEVPVALVTALAETTQEIKRLSAAADSLKGLIKLALEDHEYATVGGAPVVRWAHVKTRRLDMNALRSVVDPAVLAGCYVDDMSRRFILLSIP